MTYKKHNYIDNIKDMSNGEKYITIIICDKEYTGILTEVSN